MKLLNKSAGKILKLVPALVLFCITASNVSAFFSPSTLQLLATSVGAFFKQIIIICATAIILFIVNIKIKTRKRIKKIVGSLLILIILILLVFVGFYFYDLKDMNNPDLSYDDLLSMNAENVEKIQIYNESYAATHLLDTNNLDKEDYDSYKKIQLEQFGFAVKDALYVNFPELWDIFQINNSDIIQEKLLELNISKQDKLLIICNSATSSLIVSYYLNKWGYSAYSASLWDIEDSSFIESSIVQEINNENYIIINKLYAEKSDNNYMIFLFGIEEPIICDSSLYKPHLQRKTKVIPAKGSYDISEMDDCKYDRGDVSLLYNKDSKIVCISKLHCLLTQHYLHYLNMSDNIKELHRLCWTCS